MKMAAISPNELRDHMSDVLHRVEAGEEITIAVAGRPIAQLGPTAGRRWVSGAALCTVWHTPAPAAHAADSEQFPVSMGDPFE